ncbi:MAG: GDSL-type esterase/lipase family protein [Sarcina sp.]
MKKSHKTFLFITISLALIIISLNLLSTLSKKELLFNNGKKITADLKELQSLEKSNIKDIEDDINKIQKELNPKNITDADISSINYKDVFSSSVIMGDSQSEGLTVYGVLNATSVIAKKGDSIISAKTNNMEQLSNLSPSNIFTLYGMNDILTYQTNIDGFISDYASLIKEIQKTLPNSNIFVNSILPVEEKVIQNRPIYNEIPKYNSALKKMCADLNVIYVDSHQILIDNPALFEVDGMHLKPPFYTKWLDLLNTYL